ncbi:MAG: InlB B-repeat-containing protein, partial [Eubacterium sp.]|nr:InlB B-repeat-containing protein [Eubacterium sp.]
MLKSRKAKDTARRLAAISMAFLMVFQYTVSGLSIYSWAEDGSEARVEEVQEEKAEEKTEEKAAEEPEVKVQQPAPQSEQKEAEPEKEEPEPEKAEAPAAQTETPAEQTAEEPVNQDEPQKDAEAEDQKEEQEEEKDAEVSYPEQSFSKVVSGVTLRIQAPEGALPEGSDVTVTAVSANAVKQTVADAAGNDAKVIKALDITFKDADGKETEPKKKVSVNFEYEKFGKIDNPQVYHIPDNGPAEQVSPSSVGSYQDQVSFSAKDFSIYVIVDGEAVETHRYTYKFEDIDDNGEYKPYSFVNKAGKTVTEQMAKTGDVLESVGTPYHPGYEFQGWYIWENNAFGSKVSFTDSVGTISEDKEITVRAKYGNVYYIRFHENPYAASADEDIVLTTYAVKAGDSLAVNDIKAPVPGSGTLFAGWAVDSGKDAVDSPYTPDSSKDLYPLFSNGYWLRFVGNGYGASYTDAISIYENQDLSEITKPDDPHRQGYTFDDWYTAAEGGEKFTWSGTVTEDIVVYAHWTPETNVEYSVFYWQENADDDNYSFITSKKLRGTAGEMSNAQELTNAEKRAIDGIDWDGFEVQDIQQSSIQGDGSTVINVYYDRKYVTLIFHRDNQAPSYEQDPEGDFYRVSVSPNGTYYYNTGGDRYTQLSTSEYYNYRSSGPLAYTSGDSIQLYIRRGMGFWSRYERSDAVATVTRYKVVSGQHAVVIRAKYGSDIHDQWPQNPGGDTAWYESPRGGQSTWMLTTMPSSNEEYYYVSNNGRYTLQDVFMLQDLDDTQSFSEYTVSSMKSNTLDITLSAEDYSAVKGFSINAYSRDDAETIRNANDPGAVYDPAFPRSPRIGSDYYDGERSGNTYTIRYYYLRNKYDINFISNGSTVKTEQGIYYGADISGKTPADYVIDQTEKEIGGIPEVFKGWYDNEACEGYPYRFDKMPAGNLTLYAKWEPAWYVVKVDPAGGQLAAGQATWFWEEYGEQVVEYIPTRDYYESSEPGSDGKLYYYHFVMDTDEEDDRTAYYSTDPSVSTDGKTYAKEDGAYAFLGWYEVKNGEITDKQYDFQGGVKGDTTIKAKWRRTGSYTVAYEGHVEIDGATIGGNASQDDSSYADGAKITLQKAPTGITAGYIFDGWEIVNGNGETLDDNDGAYYKPGDEINLNSSYAGSNRVIHIQAHYTSIEESTDPVNVTTLIFDANGGKLTLAETITDANGNSVTPAVSNNRATYSNLPINQHYELSKIKDKVTPPDEGYELLGWSTDKNATEPQFEADKNITIGVDNLDKEYGGTANTLYAIWKKLPDVIWKSQDGSETLEEDKGVSVGTKPSFDKADPTKEETALYTYTFEGWAREPNQETGTKEADLPEITATDTVVTYYAAFSKTPKTYTVTYTADNGTITAPDGGKNENIPVTGTEGVTGATAAANTGYRFDGWYVNNNKISDAQAVTLSEEAAKANVNKDTEGSTEYYKDTTFTAKFVPISYKVVFNKNASDATGTMADQVFQYGEEKELTANAFTRPGYEFAGWSTTEVGTVAYTDKQKVSNLVTIDNGIVQLYAQWTPAEVNYKVEHRFQSLDDETKYESRNGYDDETKSGTTGQQTKAAAKTVEGFTAQTVTQQTIAADGSTVVTIKYDRNKYKVTYKITGEYFANEQYKLIENVPYETPLTLITDDMEKPGYTWSGWTGLPDKMPANDVAVTGSYTAGTVNYKVEHRFQSLDDETKYEVRSGYADETKSGTTGQQTEAAAKTVEGFTAQEVTQQTIAADGSTVVTIKYDRNKYKVTYKITGEYFANEQYKLIENVPYETPL